MAPASAINGRPALAHRVGSGLAVPLYWNARGNSTSIEVWHLASRATLRFAVAAGQALDRFLPVLDHTMSEPFAITGLLETHPTVRDLDGWITFYHDVVGSSAVRR